MKTTLLLAVLLSISACMTPRVTEGNPRPNVDLPKSQLSLRLLLEPGILDAYATPASMSMPAIPVQGWRATLENGFRGAFSKAYVLAAGAADLTLVIAEAELRFAATTYASNGRPISAEAQVRYQARLVDRAGAVLRRSSGTMASKRSAGAPDEATPVAAEAVESMYERIAGELFARKN